MGLFGQAIIASMLRIALLLCLTTTCKAFFDSEKEYYRDRYKVFPPTANLGDPCDMSIQKNYIDPIYDSIIQGNLNQVKAREEALINHIKGSVELQKKTCYGFVEKKVFTDYIASAAKYYECKDPGGGSPQCVCLDREPLKHTRSAGSVTGCKLVEPKNGDPCNQGVYKTLQDNQFAPVMLMFTKAQSEIQHRDAAAECYGTTAYTFNIRQDFYAKRRVACVDNNWSLYCKEGRCACRIFGPHFVFQDYVNGQCAAKSGSSCSNWNEDSEDGDTPCSDGLCVQLFNSPRILKGCGGIAAWRKAKKDSLASNFAVHIRGFSSIPVSLIISWRCYAAITSEF